MSEVNKNIGNITSKITEHGAPVLERLLDKLTGKGAIVKYSFEDLKIEMPSATDPNGRNIGGGKITIHGTITISATVQEIKENRGGTGSSNSSRTDESYRSMLKNNENTIANKTENEEFKTIDNEPDLKDYSSSSSSNDSSSN